jgi:hypothetical protein
MSRSDPFEYELGMEEEVPSSPRDDEWNGMEWKRMSSGTGRGICVSFFREDIGIEQQQEGLK